MEKRLKIADIAVGNRFRKSFGDLERLAASIKEVGLLHAIGVTKDGHKLIFGERRLRAVKMNGDDSIDCRILDIQDILAAEHAENEFREALRASEKAALAKELTRQARAQGERRGGDRKSTTAKAENQRGQLAPFDQERDDTKRTRATIAEKAGFVSPYEMERMGKVVETDVPELIEAVDQKKISISAAAKIAEIKDKEEIKEYVATNKDAKGNIKPLPRPNKNGTMPKSRGRKPFKAGVFQPANSSFRKMLGRVLDEGKLPSVEFWRKIGGTAERTYFLEVIAELPHLRLSEENGSVELVVVEELRDLGKAIRIRLESAQKIMMESNRFKFDLVLIKKVIQEIYDLVSIASTR